MAEVAPVPVHLPEVLDALAENVALPPELVRRLVRYRQGLGSVARRADLPPDVLDQILLEDHHWLVHSLALNRHVPPEVQLRLACHPDGAVRAAVVAGDPAAPHEIYERLVADEDRRVRERLAGCQGVPDDLRARLAADADPQVRVALARWWTEAPEDIRRVLLTDPVYEVRAAACSTSFARLPHPTPPVDLIPALLDDPVTRAGAVRHAVLTQELAARLAEDPDDDVRRQLAEHPQLPASVRDGLAEDASASVRVGVFARPDTPEPTRSKIYADLRQIPRSFPDVHSDDVGDEAFLRQLTDHLAVGELQDLHLDWVSADPLPHVSSPYVCFRSSAARSRSLPQDALARLLADDNLGVRLAAATAAPHLVDESAAERLDRGFRPRKQTDWRPADRFPLGQQTLRRLVTDPDPRMRCLAPRDPELPADLVERLVADHDSAVRQAVAGHPRLTLPARRALLADANAGVARAAAATPTLPVSEMDRLLTLAGL